MSDRDLFRELERRQLELSERLAATETVMESYERLLDAAWGVIEELHAELGERRGG